MSNLTWKITIAVAIIICVVTTFMYVYAKNNCFDTYTKSMYANYSLEQLEGELTEEEGCFAVYGEYNKVYDCNYIIAYKKHGNLIRLIRRSKYKLRDITYCKKFSEYNDMGKNKINIATIFLNYINGFYNNYIITNSI